MRILFINHAYAPSIGGCQITTARLASGLMQRGHDCAVVCGRHDQSLPAEDVIDSVVVRRFDFDRVFGPSADDPRQGILSLKMITKELGEFKQKFRPDVIHLNLADSSAFFHLKTEQYWAAPTIINPQEALPDTAADQDSALGALFSTAAGVVGHSSFAADAIAAATGWTRHKIGVVYPGVPAADFTPKRCPTAARHLVFVGRLVPQKGADIAMHSLAQLRGEVTLTIVGDGPERPHLQDLCTELGIAHRVQFVADADDERRRQVLSSAFAMIVPSRHQEQFGMTAVEGGLSGLPVVASAIGGLPEIVVDGETGFVAAPGDDTSFATAVTRLLDDPAPACDMGAAGRKRCESLFNVEQMVASYEDVYNEALDCVSRKGRAS